ncbi:hypothetical protein ABZV52_14915 [Streptomyces sp. NPDC004735]
MKIFGFVQDDDGNSDFAPLPDTVKDQAETTTLTNGQTYTDANGDTYTTD